MSTTRRSDASVGPLPLPLPLPLQLPHPYTPYPDAIVNFCPTGMIPTKTMTPHVPITPAEVVEQSCRALELGVAIVHLHARDADGKPTYRGELYEEMILGIRGHHPDAIVCVSCSGRNFPEFEGLLGAAPYYFNLLLGSRYSVPATVRHLSNMIADLPPGSVWSAAGIGLFQLPMNALAIAMGGHCRVGIEDNIYHDFGRQALATNEGLVERLVRLSEIFGRPLASPARARELLGLGPAPTAAFALASTSTSTAAPAQLSAARP